MVEEKKYKVMSEDEAKRLIPYIKERLKEWHDFKPDYIFLDETSAIPLGYVFKEGWKKAYSGNEFPLFYRVNPRSLTGEIGSTYKEDDKWQKLGTHLRYIEKKKNFFEKRIIKKDARIIVFDEESPHGESPGRVKKALEDYGINPKNIMVDMGNIQGNKNHGWIGQLPGTSPRTGYSAPTETDLFDVSWHDDSSFMRLGENAGPNFSSDKIDNIKMVGKIKKSKEGEKYSPSIYGKEERTPMRILDYIHDLKKIGREAGLELKDELEKGKNLEDRITLAIAIGSLVISILFLSMNINGNSIFSINQKFTNGISIIFFIIGLVGSFVYFKRQKD